MSQRVHALITIFIILGFFSFRYIILGYLLLSFSLFRVLRFSEGELEAFKVLLTVA